MADEDRIARVARALCVADGNDPDAEFTIETYGDEGDGDRFHEVVASTWTSYAGEARRLMAAMIALGVIE